MLNMQQLTTEIATVKSFWFQRNKKFKEWYDLLLMIDKLATKNMESYVSNEPATFYQMAHYLLTKGELSHYIPVLAESVADLDTRAKVHRGCQYMWNQIDHKRRLGGNQPFIDELAFYLLVLGWYSVVYMFDKNTGLLSTNLWNPADTYPRYSNGNLSLCVHSYSLTQTEAKDKADSNSWAYTPPTVSSSTNVVLDDVFMLMDNILYNIVLIDSKDVTGWQERPEMRLLVAPVGGFPDKGSLTNTSKDWRSFTGKGIFELNEGVASSFNKWKSIVAQILRDTAQPVIQEFSATPQATVEQLRERGAFFHYSPNEKGLERVPPASIPIELQGNLIELRREMQKGSFNDAVFGMMEGQPGYALSLLASSSANQILYPYMDGKHFVISEGDSFWLSNLKTSKRVFDVKGKLIEKIKPTDIPEEVNVIVESDVATPKDWLERGTIGGMVREDLDKATLLSEIYKMSDPQTIIRRKSLDRLLDHPTSQLIEMIAGYQVHADYLERRGDAKQAALFRRAAAALETQVGAPAPGQGSPVRSAEIESAREAGTPVRKPTVPSRVNPPEQKGFTPQELRRAIGKGKVSVA